MSGSIAPAVRELDLNPVVVHGEGEEVVVLDGIVVVGSPSSAS